MNNDFTGEELTKLKCIHRIARYQAPGGWYIRVVFSEVGRLGKGLLNEAALYIPDPDHVWSTEDFAWEKLENNPQGGIFRAKVHNGWIILGTMRSDGYTDDGDKYHPRLGSLVFIPDVGNSWQCNTVRDSDSK